jgi:RNA polymerase sigma-70 factor (ECF subfamily)
MRPPAAPPIAPGAAGPVPLDLPALEPLVRAVVSAILRAPPGHPDVDDATHESLRRAIEGAARIDGEARIRPWVVGIARHVAHDQLRARKRSREREERDAPEPLGDDDPHLALERARRKQALDRAIAQLPEGAKQALLLFHVEELPYQAIAARLGVPVGTVATWIARGRKSLSTILHEGSREKLHEEDGR